MQNLAKSDASFREASRREDAELIRAAFKAHSQAAMAREASKRLAVSERQIVNWLKCDNDMPSWVPKAVKAYLAKVEAAAQRIEGRR